jgi:hypothetical protein
MAELTLTIGTRDALTFTRASVGAKGDPGAAGTNGTNGTNGANATLTVGSVTTLAAGASATVTNTGTSSAAVLAFGIPAGPAGANGTNGTNGINGTNGAPGAAATVAVGTVSTGAAGSSATVTNAGTANAAVLNFAIPRGNTGATASVAVGTTTTGAAGTNATVTNSGTTSCGGVELHDPPRCDGRGGDERHQRDQRGAGRGGDDHGRHGHHRRGGIERRRDQQRQHVGRGAEFHDPPRRHGRVGERGDAADGHGRGAGAGIDRRGTTYTAQNIATQAELDAVASTLTETGLAVADHETRLDALDGIGAGSPHGTHAFWGVRMLTNHGGARFTLGEMEIRATPGGADQCTGGTPYASSEYPTFGLAANAFDNDPANTWKAADGPIVPTLVGYLFAAPVAAAAVRLTPEAVTQFPADVEIVYGAHTPTSATDPDLVVAWSASTTSPGDTTPQLLTDPAYVAPGTSLVDTVATHGTRLTTVEARPALPTATAAGQAPVSTGAGAGYAATDIATQAEHDTLKARVAMLDGTGAPVGSIYGAHTDWRLYITESNDTYVGTSDLAFRESPGGPLIPLSGAGLMVSSELSGRGKAGATDGNVTTQWLSDGSAMPQWFSIKFATARTLYEILWTAPNDAGYRIPRVAKTQYGDFGSPRSTRRRGARASSTPARRRAARRRRRSARSWRATCRRSTPRRSRPARWRPRGSAAARPTPRRSCAATARSRCRAARRSR